MALPVTKDILNCRKGVVVVVSGVVLPFGSGEEEEAEGEDALNAPTRNTGTDSKARIVQKTGDLCRLRNMIERVFGRVAVEVNKRCIWATREKMGIGKSQSAVVGAKLKKFWIGTKLQLSCCFQKRLTMCVCCLKWRTDRKKPKILEETTTRDQDCGEVQQRRCPSWF